MSSDYLRIMPEMLQGEGKRLRGGEKYMKGSWRELKPQVTQTRTKGVDTFALLKM